jgi:hypothetical protein
MARTSIRSDITFCAIFLLNSAGKVPAEKEVTKVVADPAVMSGDPVVEGTDILAETIMSHARNPIRTHH